MNTQTTKIKPIIWKEYDGRMLGFCGGLKLFDYEHEFSNPQVGYLLNFKLKTKLPYPPMTLSSRENCEKMALALLQKFVDKIVE